MTVTLKSLRQEVGKDLAACVTGTVDSGSTTNIVDAELLDADEEATRFARHYVKMVSGDAAGESRRVRETEGYAPDTGTLAWGRAMSAAPSADDEYEIHALVHPDDLDRLINVGLQRCHYIDEEEIDVVSGQREYALAAYTWLKRKKQVVRLQWVQGTTANKKRHLPMWWQVEEDAGVLTLHVRPYTAATGQTMILTATRPYAALATDAGETACPEDWVRAAAVLEVYHWLVRNGPAQDIERYRTARDEARIVFGQKSRRYAPRPTLVIRRPDTARFPWSSEIVT